MTLNHLGCSWSRDSLLVTLPYFKQYSTQKFSPVQHLIVKLKSQSCPKLPKSAEIAPKMDF